MELKELKELLKVLRDKGVLEYRTSQVELKLSEEAPQSKYKRRQEADELEEQELTEEELLYYSATSPLDTEAAQ